jgi:hypothetical protein
MMNHLTGCGAILSELTRGSLVVTILIVVGPGSSRLAVGRHKIHDL